MQPLQERGREQALTAAELEDRDGTRAPWHKPADDRRLFVAIRDEVATAIQESVGVLTPPVACAERLVFLFHTP